VVHDDVFAQPDPFARPGGSHAEGDFLFGADHLGFGSVVAGEDV
jgi:hypothetical protein